VQAKVTCAERNQSHRFLGGCQTLWTLQDVTKLLDSSLGDAESYGKFTKAEHL
jgi:hypothetical protein